MSTEAPKPCVHRLTNTVKFEQEIESMARDGYRLHSWSAVHEFVSTTERVADISVSTTQGLTVFYALFVPATPAPPPQAAQPMRLT